MWIGWRTGDAPLGTSVIVFTFGNGFPHRCFRGRRCAILRSNIAATTREDVFESDSQEESSVILSGAVDDVLHRE